MKKLLLSLFAAAALAACSDSPTGAPDAPEGMRVVKVYSEGEFAAAGITAPSISDIVARAGRPRVNTVTGGAQREGGPSAIRYCPDQYPYQIQADYYDCYPWEPVEPVDCYSNPYAAGCGDPCNWNASLPGCPVIGPLADFGYGSSATGPVWVNRGGLLLKEVSLTSWSQANANVAFTTLDASFRNVGAESGSGCGNVSQQFDSSHSSGSGSPLTLQASRVANYLGTVKWEVAGTHSFSPVSGASGGGTFYSSNAVCG